MHSDFAPRVVWCFGAPVWLCALLLFPLQLGSVGAPALVLLAYVPLAAGLLLVADVLHNPAFYRLSGTVRGQAAPYLAAVALPAALSFGLGSIMAPLDEAVEDDLCQIRGFAASSDTAIDELDETYDLTADCAPH